MDPSKEDCWNHGTPLIILTDVRMIKRLRVMWQQDLSYCTLTVLQGNSDRTLVHRALTFEKSNYPHCFYNSTRCYPAFAAVKSFVLNVFLILWILESFEFCTLSLNQFPNRGAKVSSFFFFFFLFHYGQSLDNWFQAFDGNLSWCRLQFQHHSHKEKARFPTFPQGNFWS